MDPVRPGSSPVYTAAPVPAGTSLDSAQPLPVWSTSDPVNAPVTADASGLVASVAVPAEAPDQTQFTLTITYTNADGTIASGSITDLIVAPAPPVQPILSFDVTRTS